MRAPSPSSTQFQGTKKAISNEQTTLRFEETGTVSSHVSPDGGISVATTRLDDELEKLTLLKLDIEGFEARALEGASHLIRTQLPRMAICVYHYAQDLLDIVEQLDKLVEGYHFRLRQHSPGHYYDLVLYASPSPVPHRRLGRSRSWRIHYQEDKAMVEGAKSPPRHDVDRYCVSGYFAMRATDSAKPLMFRTTH